MTRGRTLWAGVAVALVLGAASTEASAQSTPLAVQAAPEPAEFANPGSDYRAIYQGPGAEMATARVRWRPLRNDGNPSTAAMQAWFAEAGLGVDLRFTPDIEGAGPPYFEIFLDTASQLDFQLLGLRVRNAFSDAGVLLAGEPQQISGSEFGFQLSRGRGAYNRAALAGNLLDVILRSEAGPYVTLTFEINPRSRHYLIGVWGRYVGAVASPAAM